MKIWPFDAVGRRNRGQFISRRTAGLAHGTVRVMCNPLPVLLLKFRALGALPGDVPFLSALIANDIPGIPDLAGRGRALKLGTRLRQDSERELCVGHGVLLRLGFDLKDLRVTLNGLPLRACRVQAGMEARPTTVTVFVNCHALR